MNLHPSRYIFGHLFSLKFSCYFVKSFVKLTSLFITILYSFITLRDGLSHFGRFTLTFAQFYCQEFIDMKVTLLIVSLYNGADVMMG